jgi:hypothetical protein
MVKVVPLRFGAVFKRAFSDPEVLSRLASDALGLHIHVDRVQPEYLYAVPTAGMRVTYELLAADPRARAIVEVRHVVEPDFAVIVSDRDMPLGMFRRRIVWLHPKHVDTERPFGVRRWLELIVASLDGEVDERRYQDPMMTRVIDKIREDAFSPEELARVKDDARDDTASLD